MSPVPTADQALANAGRLLDNAEIEQDLVRMERMIDLANAWIDIAGVLVPR